jgi:hypothetical protein
MTENGLLSSIHNGITHVQLEVRPPLGSWDPKSSRVLHCPTLLYYPKFELEFNEILTLI